MTGYKSKRAAAQDKLAQPAQEPVVCKHQWFRTGAMAINECRCINCGVWNTVAPLQPAQDKLEQAAFDAWWDTQPRLNETNPCNVDSFEYWAWAGWQAALAQPAQEPVAWMNPTWVDPDTRGWQSHSFESIPIEGWLPIYTTPPQRPWVGLTKENMPDGEDPMYDHPFFIAGMVWAANKLMEKNT